MEVTMNKLGMNIIIRMTEKFANDSKIKELQGSKMTQFDVDLFVDSHFEPGTNEVVYELTMFNGFHDKLQMLYTIVRVLKQHIGKTNFFYSVKYISFWSSTVIKNVMIKLFPGIEENIQYKTNKGLWLLTYEINTIGIYITRIFPTGPDIHTAAQLMLEKG